ncbi:MAG TPA: PIN domain-containing protein [Chitinophagales bacterium]
MNGIRILCDTNVLIQLLNNNDDVVDFLTDKQVYISSITELELYKKTNLTVKEIKIIDMLVENCYIVELTQPVKQYVKQFSRKYKLKLPDTIIAASAIYSDIPLVTFDTDFSAIEELNLVLLKL